MRIVYIRGYFEAELTFPVFVPDLDNTGLPNKLYLPIVKNDAGAGTPPPVNPGNGFFVTHPIRPNQSAITWRMYYTAGQRVAMRISHGPTTDPYPAPGATQDEVYYLLGDHLGSTTVTVNLDGTVKSRVRYDAWGKTRYSSGTTPTDRKYTGQIEEAPVGLYFYNARWYDPSLGRFIQADTIIPQPGNPLAWDRYAYVNSNPINSIDPSGNKACDGEFSGGDRCDSSGLGSGQNHSSSSQNKTAVYSYWKAAPTPQVPTPIGPQLPINVFPTMSPSPTAYYNSFTAGGPLSTYTPWGFYFDDDTAGISRYRIEYKADFTLENQGLKWSLTINERFIIGETSSAQKSSTTSTYILFSYPNGKQEKVNLSTINGGFFPVDEMRTTMLDMQFKGQYPKDVIIFITPGIEEVYMQNPFQGTNFEYAFTSKNWTRR